MLIVQFELLDYKKTTINSKQKTNTVNCLFFIFQHDNFTGLCFIIFPHHNKSTGDKVAITRRIWVLKHFELRVQVRDHQSLR